MCISGISNITIRPRVSAVEKGKEEMSLLLLLTQMTVTSTKQNNQVKQYVDVAPGFHSMSVAVLGIAGPLFESV